MVLPNPKVTFKALLLDYDELLTYSDIECCYSLSEREIQMLLAFVEYIGWKTRYIATETEIDQSLILHWQGNLARKLMSGCCGDSGKIFRYLPDGTYQSSEDGGETWTDDPDADVRLSAPLAPPLPGDDNSAKRCAAADNVRDQYKVMRDNTIALLTAGTTVLAIVAGLVGLIGFILSISIVGVTFGVMLFGVAAALLDLTPEEVADEIDDEALETFRCIVYCQLDDSGRVKTGGLDEILSEIADQFDGFQETFFYSITATMQATGINNAATLGVATASDCGDCPDCPAPCIDPSWIVIGTFIEMDDTTITIDSVFDGGYGANMVVYGSNTTGAYCCRLEDYAALTGGVVAAGYVDCDGGSHPSESPVHQFFGEAQFVTTGAGTRVRLRF